MVGRNQEKGADDDARQVGAHVGRTAGGGLIGLALAAPNPVRFALADRYFSYEPYALMLRRGDPAFHRAVNRVLARQYRSGQIL